MAEDTANLQIKVQSNEVVTAKGRLAGMGVAAGGAERATDGLSSAVKRLVGAAAALAVFKQVTTLIAEYESTMSGVRAVTLATADDMKALDATARQLGETTRFSARQAAEGMRLLGQAGFKTEQIIAALPGTLELAIAGGLSIAEAADISAAALAGFRMKAEQAGHAADILAAAASNSNTNVFQMGDAIKYVAPIAAGMGISMEDTAAAIGVLSNAGLQGSMAGTGLRQVLSSLATPTKQASDTLKAYGLTVKDVNPATHSLTEILNTLATAGLTTTDALIIAGDRGGNALSALVAGTPKLEQLNTVMANAGGEAKRMADVMNDNLIGDALALRSAIEELGLKIGDAGLKGQLRGATQELTTFVRGINGMVSSGEAAAWLDFLRSKVALLDEGFTNAAYNIADTWEALMEYLRGDGAESAEDIVDAFKNMPENIRALILLTATSFGVLSEYGHAAGEGMYNSVASWFVYLLKTAKNVSKEIGDQLTNVFGEGEFDYTAAQAEAFEEFSALALGAGNSWDIMIAKQEAATAAFEEQVTAILNERDVNIEASEKKLDNINRLREAYNKMRAAREAAEAEKKTGGTVVAPETGGTETPAHFDVQGFEALRKSLQNETDMVLEMYNERRELIMANTKESSDLQVSMLQELESRLAAEMDAAKDATIERLDGQYEVELTNLQLSLDQRLITEEEFQKKSKDAWGKYTKGLVAVGTKGTAEVSTKQLEMWSTSLSMASNMAGMMSDLVGENTAAAKAMFAISKAIAIAEILINTHLGAAKAVGQLGVFGIPMSSMIMATGYASAAMTAAMAIQQFEHGGMIPSGQYGMVGEAGVELVKGPAVVTSARTTADMGKSTAADRPIMVSINNYAGAEVSVQEQDTQDGKMVEVIIKRATKEVANDIRGGSGPVSNALSGTFGLRRGVA